MAKKAVRKAAKPAAKKAAKKAVKKAAKKAGKPVKASAAKAPVKAAKKLAAKKTVKKAAKKAAPKAAPKTVTVDDGCAPGYPQLTLSLTVRDMRSSIAFYEAAFGFKLDFSMPGPDGTGLGHAQMTYFGARIMFSPEGAMGSTNRTPATSGVEPAAQCYVYCPDVDAFTARARAGGAKVLVEPVDMFWGDRMAHLEDLDGYRWAFATNKGPFDPSKAQPH